MFAVGSALPFNAYCTLRLRHKIRLALEKDRLAKSLQLTAVEAVPCGFAKKCCDGYKIYPKIGQESRTIRLPVPVQPQPKGILRRSK
jgi:hypothetical protein